MGGEWDVARSGLSWKSFMFSPRLYSPKEINDGRIQTRLMAENNANNTCRACLQDGSAVSPIDRDLVKCTDRGITSITDAFPPVFNGRVHKAVSALVSHLYLTGQYWSATSFVDIP